MKNLNVFLISLHFKHFLKLKEQVTPDACGSLPAAGSELIPRRAEGMQHATVTESQTAPTNILQSN